MAYVDDLKTIRDGIATDLVALRATLAASLANPKPSYSVDGRSFSWTEYRARLVQQQGELADQLRNLNAQYIKALGSVEHSTIALS